jgi:NAD(P)H-flavin reductase
VTATTTAPRRYSARITGIDDVGSDTRILKLELENRQRLPFAAGQYALLATVGHEARPFSIASTPDAAHLEFHIRSAGQGLSDFLVNHAQLGAEISLEAPFGTSHWRASDRPLLALAGGLGVAPLKAILETQLATAGSPPCHLYWGVRAADQLYLDHFFRSLAQKYPRFGYIPVLSDTDTAETYRTGFISDAVAADFDTLAGFDIYMAGPPPMVAATLPALLHHGAESDHIFSDAWPTAEKGAK